MGGAFLCVGAGPSVEELRRRLVAPDTPARRSAPAPRKRRAVKVLDSSVPVPAKPDPFGALVVAAIAEMLAAPKAPPSPKLRALLEPIRPKVR